MTEDIFPFNLASTFYGFSAQDYISLIKIINYFRKDLVKC